ncbi:tRNA-binding protein [Candidatus Micrarchaeota archaeon]|nr:tRNA-binding protein [Candidatus Micrarchaeota archaeon]MBU1165782.1 tRNA-binding protein [Candidatus Micrarchaeota archaeon]MBU1886302.1 tRNA-binding protein [Candidatus Micrarchaeota archaeon]
MATWEDFQKIDIRVGTVIKAEEFQGAKIPAYKLEIDFGTELGIKRSSARLVRNYKKEDLVGRQVICVVNFPKKQIANFFSEVLVMGVYAGSDDNVVLLQAERKVNNGDKIG